MMAIQRKSPVYAPCTPCMQAPPRNSWRELDAYGLGVGE